MAINISDLVTNLKPFVLKWIQEYAVSGGGGASSVVTAAIVPTTVTLSSTNSYTGGTLSHAISTSSSTGAAAAILATNASGNLSIGGTFTADGRIRSNTDYLASGASAAYFFQNRSGSNSWGLYATGDIARIYDGTADRWLVDTSGNVTNTGTLSVANLTTVTRTSEQLRLRYDASNYASFTVSSGGNLTVTPTGTQIILPDSKAFRTTTYSSGFAGSGFIIDQGVTYASQSTAEFDNLIVRGLMRVYELVINKIRVSRGSLIVSPGGGKVASVSGSGPYTLTFDDDHGLVTNDLLRAQKFTGSGTYQSLLTVTGVPTSSTATVTLSSGSAPAAGYEYAVTGNTSTASRQGVLYLTADDPGSPFMDIVAGLTAHSGGSGWGSTSLWRTRVGRVDGIFSGTNEYGLYAGNGTATSNQYIRVTNQNFLLNNVPLKMYSGGNQTVNIDSAGTDIWVGPSSSDKRLTWDGTNLGLKGNLFIGASGTGVPFAVAPLLHCAFDVPRTGNAVNTNGHRGQVPSITGGVHGMAGKFGGGVLVGEATTNRIVNPSVETNTTGYSSSGTVTLSRSTDYALFGSYALKWVWSSGTADVFYNVSGTLATSTTLTFSVYARRSDGAAVSGVSAYIDSSLGTLSPTITDVGGGWYHVYATRTTGGSLGNHIVGLTGLSTSVNWYFDGWQVEAKAYTTPYCDGSLGDGYAWTGTAHASTSTRTAAVLAYPNQRNINPNKGTVSAWVHMEYYKTGLGHLIWNAGDTNGEFQGQISASGVLQLYVNGVNVDHQTNVTAGWHHVAFTWDIANNQSKVYLDGVASSSTGSPTTTPPTLHASTIQVGGSAIIGTTYNHNSQIRDFAIIDRVLTAAEVAAIYNSNAPLNVGRNNYELVLAELGYGKVVANASGIFGTDNQSTPKPTFSLVNADTTVNSESLTAGDTLLGDNSSGKGNVLFDQSAGKLRIRAGTTDVLTFDSAGTVDGVLSLGSGGIWQGSSGSFASPTTGFKLYKDGSSGNGFLDVWNSGDISIRLDPASGVIIRAGSEYAADKTVSFQTNTGARAGELYGYTDATTHRSVRLRSYSNSNSFQSVAYMDAVAENTTGKAFAQMRASKFASPSTYNPPYSLVSCYTDLNTSDTYVTLYAHATSGSSGTVTLRDNNGTTSFTATAASKSWRVDHPLDPFNKWLDHFTVEGPGHYTYYKGRATLDQNGRAWVQLPEYFDALNKDVEIVYSAKTGEMGRLKLANDGEVIDNTFGFLNGEPGQVVSWIVTGERADMWALAHPTQPEKIKDADERGRLAAYHEYGYGPEYAMPFKGENARQASGQSLAR